MFSLKRIIAVFIVVIMALSLGACKRKNDLINNEVPVKEQTDFTILGEWTVAKIEAKRSDDVLKKVIADVLADYFKEGMKITFNDDNTAICNNEPLTYKIEGEELRLEWEDKTKNFNLHLKGTNSAIELSSNDIVFITLTNNK